MTAKAGGAAQSDWRRSTGLRVLFAILLVAAAGYVVWYHDHYLVWPGQPAGAPIAWCGHVYQSGGTGLTLRDVESKASGTVTDIGSYPPIGPRQKLYAHTRGSGCPAEVFLQTGSNQFTAYRLAGGH